MIRDLFTEATTVLLLVPEVWYLVPMEDSPLLWDEHTSDSYCSLYVLVATITFYFFYSLNCF